MTQKERIKIQEIMKRYSLCYDEIDSLEQSIQKLKTDKDNLINKLKGIRNDERDVVNELKNKYGEDAKLDLEKIEIIDEKD